MYITYLLLIPLGHLDTTVDVFISTLSVLYLCRLVQVLPDTSRIEGLTSSPPQVDRDNTR